MLLIESNCLNDLHYDIDKCLDAFIMSKHVWGFLLMSERFEIPVFDDKSNEGLVDKEFYD